jgi:hypothetical protein
LRAQRFEHGRNIRGVPAQPEGRNLEVLLFGNAEPDDKEPVIDMKDFEDDRRFRNCRHRILP